MIRTDPEQWHKSRLTSTTWYGTAVNGITYWILFINGQREIDENYEHGFPTIERKQGIIHPRTHHEIPFIGESAEFMERPELGNERYSLKPSCCIIVQFDRGYLRSALEHRSANIETYAMHVPRTLPLLKAGRWKCVFATAN